MAQLVESTLRNPAALLREQLDTLERLAVKPDAATVVPLLTTLDAIEQQFLALEQDGMDLRPERVRWSNITDRLRTHPRLIARAAGSLPGGMAALRAQHAPAAGFWWHADEERARRLRRSLLSSAAVVGIAASVLVAAYLAFTWFFPPDPRAVAMVEATAAIDSRLAEEDWEGALAAAEQAFAAWPDSEEMAIWVGVLAEHTEDAARSAEALEAARRLTGADLTPYWVRLSEVRQQAGDYEAAMAAADEALALSPDSAEANFMKGKAALLLNDRDTALEYLDRTYTLAADTQPQLAVNARILWGDLLQRMPLEATGDAEPATPTPAP